MEIIEELNQRHLTPHAELIVKVCHALRPDTLAAMLEIARGLAVKWPEGSNMALAERTLAARLKVTR